MSRQEPPLKKDNIVSLMRIPRVPRAIRNYNAATHKQIYNDFTPSMASADAEIYPALARLRARARYLERNTAVMTRFLRLFEDNIVGHSGFRLHVGAKVASTGEMRTVANRAIEAAFKAWCSEAVTVDGHMDMVAAAKHAVRTYGRDGEVFIQIVTGPSRPDRVALKFIEADLIDETYNARLKNGNEVRMGVELDTDERPVAYYMLVRHPGDYQYGRLLTSQSDRERIPAENILHIFVKSRPHQTRGVPPSSPIMNDTKMLSGYREAELVNRRVSASKMGFFTKADDAGPVSGLSDEEDDQTGELTTEVEPGRTQVLPKGYDFKEFDPSGGSLDYGAFEKQILRSIASGLGPSYFDLAMDLDDVSYSSIRQGALSDRDMYRGIQQFFTFKMITPIYKAWLRMNLGIHEDIPVLATQYDTFRRASKFIPRGWSWVDPQKEVASYGEAIDRKLTSRSQVVSEQGGDFEEVVDDLAREEQYIAGAGLAVEVQKNEGLAPNTDDE